MIVGIGIINNSSQYRLIVCVCESAMFLVFSVHLCFMCLVTSVCLLYMCSLCSVCLELLCSYSVCCALFCVCCIPCVCCVQLLCSLCLVYAVFLVFAVFSRSTKHTNHNCVWCRPKPNMLFFFAYYSIQHFKKIYRLFFSLCNLFFIRFHYSQPVSYARKA